MWLRVLVVTVAAAGCSSSSPTPQPPDDPEPIVGNTEPAPDAGQEEPDKMAAIRAARYFGDAADVYAQAGIIQATRRIEARCQTKPHLSGTDNSILNTTHRHECTNPGTEPPFQFLETIAY